MIDAGEDVHDAHLNELEQAGVLQAALGFLAAGDFDFLMIVSQQLLEEITLAVLDAGKVGMRLHQIIESRGVDFDVLGIGTVEDEFVAEEAWRSRQ